MTDSTGKNPCSPHPNAPHGFNRNASHNAGRYVCVCEGWAVPAAATQPEDTVQLTARIGEGAKAALLRCPFCGESNAYAARQDVGAVVRCGNCSARTVSQHSIEGAAIEWNRRAVQNLGANHFLEALQRLTTGKQVSSDAQSVLIGEFYKVAGMFPNYGTAEQDYIDHAKHSCPACGGSGHIDDYNANKAGFGKSNVLLPD
jgi:hypothetical protein